MRIGNRLFPYPLLNHEHLYSQYKDFSFDLKFEGFISEDKEYVLHDLCVETNSNFIKGLVNQGKAKIVCTVECPQTMYRRTFEIGLSPRDIKISLYDLSGKMAVKAFAYALDDIVDYDSDEFIDEYRDYKFDIEKNDILAVDDGYITRINFDEDDDTKKASIFLVIKDGNIKDETMRVEFDTSKITISLPPSQWDVYDKTKKQKKFENLYFSIIAIPALTQCVATLQRMGDSVDQLCMDYKWFNSFAKQYAKINEKPLDDEAFPKMDAAVEAQKMLNTPVTKSIDDIFNLLVMPNLGGNDND